MEHILIDKQIVDKLCFPKDGCPVRFVRFVRFPFCRFAISPFWRRARLVTFPAHRFAALARTPFRKESFPFRGPR